MCREYFAPKKKEVELRIYAVECEMDSITLQYWKKKGSGNEVGDLWLSLRGLGVVVAIFWWYRALLVYSLFGIIPYLECQSMIT